MGYIIWHNRMYHNKDILWFIKRCSLTIASICMWSRYSWTRGPPDRWSCCIIFNFIIHAHICHRIMYMATDICDRVRFVSEVHLNVWRPCQGTSCTILHTIVHRVPKYFSTTLWLGGDWLTLNQHSNQYLTFEHQYDGWYIHIKMHIHIAANGHLCFSSVPFT